jgi:predicted ester cyclase
MPPSCAPGNALRDLMANINVHTLRIRRFTTHSKGENPMSVEENKAVVRRFYEELWANLDNVDEIIAADVTAGDIHGLDAYKHVMSEWITGFPDGVYVVEDIIAEGDKVVARHSFSGTHTGEWFGIPPTNKQVSVGGTFTYRIADGKIVEQWGHWSAFRLHTQLGTIPPWEEMVKQAQSKLE